MQVSCFIRVTDSSGPLRPAQLVDSAIVSSDLAAATSSRFVSRQDPTAISCRPGKRPKKIFNLKLRIVERSGFGS